MKVGVWGAGNIGSGLARRLVTTAFVSELFWTNRNYEEIERTAIDLEHGLAFAPTCHSVHCFPMESIGRMLSQIDVLVLTLGHRVPPEATREQMFKLNADVFRSTVLAALHSHFKGIVLVITNPVDLMARLVFREAHLDKNRVIGLGTVVESARLQACLGAYLSPKRPARDVWAHAIGTHDANFIPLVVPGLAVGDTTPPKELEDLKERARKEVSKAAERVKTDKGSSLHPIVEGAIQVIEAIAYDRRSVLTVSVLDPNTREQLFYSVPCIIGGSGVEGREQPASFQAALEGCCERLRKTLQQADES